MLAVNSKDYFTPVKLTKNNQNSWLLFSRTHSGEALTAFKFNFTIPICDNTGKQVNHFTLTYDGVSVKPTPRSLRVFKSDICQKVVSKFSSNTEINLEAKVELPDWLTFGLE